MLVTTSSTEGLYYEGQANTESLFIVEVDLSNIAEPEYSVTKSEVVLPSLTPYGIDYENYNVFVDNNNSFVIKLRNFNGVSENQSNKLFLLSNDGQYSSIYLDMNYGLSFTDQVYNNGSLTHYFPTTANIEGSKELIDIAFNNNNFATLEQYIFASGPTSNDFQEDYNYFQKVVKLFDYSGNILSRNYIVKDDSSSDINDPSINQIDFSVFEEIDYVFELGFSSTNSWSVGDCSGPLRTIQSYGSGYLVNNFRGTGIDCFGENSLGYSLGGENLLLFDLYALSTPENEISKIKIYPNPSSDLLFIKGFDGLPLDVVIFDMLGKKVIEQKVIEKINIGFLEIGVYFLTISDGINTSSHQVVKN